MNAPICCAACEHPLLVPAELFGRVVKCPNCGNIVSVPAPDADAAPVVDAVPMEPAYPETKAYTRTEPSQRYAGEKRAVAACAVIGGLAALPLLTLLLGVGLWLLTPPPAPVAVGPPTTAASSHPADPTQPTLPTTPALAPTEVKPPPDGLPAPIQPVTLVGPEISLDWNVAFRSHDPGIWNTNVRGGDQHFAAPLAGAPDDMTYLRLRHDAQFVVVEMSKVRLLRAFFTGDCGWNGTNVLARGGRHLGVVKKSERPKETGDVCVTGPSVFSPFDGWGFGRREKEFDRQGYSWDGRSLPPTVLEIAVKTGGLTDAEKKQLVVSSVRIPPLDPPTLAGDDVSKDWTVLLRSADPSIWDREVERDANQFAQPLARAPEDLRYLRLRKQADYVVVPMTKANLKRLVTRGDYGWQGTDLDDSHALHLGIFAKKMELFPQRDQRDKGEICIRILPWHRGWGFGHKNWINDGQGYCWEGKTIAPTVFEIAVKPGELTAEERERLLGPDDR